MSTIKQDYYEQLSPLVYAITGIEVIFCLFINYLFKLFFLCVFYD